MAYQVLARKYRPANFSEIVGQEGIALAMANGIRLGRIPAAVIFSGVRGTGKTTLARLFAKALNCQQGPTPEPCGVCESCSAIAISCHEDVLEIDGASHTGIDEIRALQETMAYVPRRSQFKIYLIDEVHMLSMSAFNALLKTIEEPPPHVKFVFATTELGRVPDTIQGRCQVFHLKKIPSGMMVERLAYVCSKEGIKADRRALEALAQAGRGSLRDALTLLDQAIARGHGEVQLEHVSGAGLTVDRHRVIRFLHDMIRHDLGAVVGHIAAWDEAGADLSEAVEECARHARHAFVLRHLGSDRLKAEYLGLDAEDEAELVALAQIASDGALNKLFTALMNCRNELQGAALDRFVFENHCFEWQLATHSATAHAPSAPPLKALAPQPNPPPSPPNLTTPPFVPMATTIAKSSELPLIQNTPATPKHEPVPKFPPNWRELVDQWKRLKPLQGRILEEAYSLEYGPSQIIIGVKKESMAAGKLLHPEIQRRTADEFRLLFAFEGILKVVLHEPMNQSTMGSLLDDKRRDRAADHDRLLKAASEHPITQEGLRLFGGTIKTSLSNEQS